MSLEFNIKQIGELIRRNYRVPRFAEFTINTDPALFKTPEHISMKDLLLPLLEDYKVTKKREAYLIDLVKYLTVHGGVFHYQNNPDKQKFMNELAAAIPDANWAIFYEPTASYGKPKTDGAGPKDE